jgi:hypothetical protein
MSTQPTEIFRSKLPSPFPWLCAELSLYSDLKAHLIDLISKGLIELPKTHHCDHQPSPSLPVPIEWLPCADRYHRHCTCLVFTRASVLWTREGSPSKLLRRLIGQAARLLWESRPCRSSPWLTPQVHMTRQKHLPLKSCIFLTSSRVCLTESS